MQTIGERLEEARKRKGISIREASEATKIRGEYLYKFESNQFDLKLPDIYLRGFLRLYANFLKLPGDKIVNDYQALGLGEGGRPGPKPLSREIYGKMEITHASASGAASRGSSTDVAPSSAAAAMTPGADSVASPQRQPFQPRMPLGGLGRALESRSPWLLIVGSVVLVGLVVWATVFLVGGHSPSAPVKPAPAAVEAAADSVYLVALRPVQVTSVKDKVTSAELGAPRSLAVNERYALTNADMLISVSDRSAVQFEHNNIRYGAGTNSGPGVLIWERK